jgi:hypothetical protein
MVNGMASKALIFSFLVPVPILFRDVKTKEMTPCATYILDNSDRITFMRHMKNWIEYGSRNLPLNKRRIE